MLSALYTHTVPTRHGTRRYVLELYPVLAAARTGWGGRRSEAGPFACSTHAHGPARASVPFVTLISYFLCVRPTWYPQVLGYSRASASTPLWRWAQCGTGSGPLAGTRDTPQRRTLSLTHMSRHVSYSDGDEIKEALCSCCTPGRIASPSRIGSSCHPRRIEHEALSRIAGRIASS